MILKKNKPKIATILPYKESYTLQHASAVSLWVSGFFKRSFFKESNYIFGNANSDNYLTKNYKNIPLQNLKLKFKSTSNEYINKLITEIIKIKFDIIEVHNRPLVLLKIMENIKAKFILYYHNDIKCLSLILYIIIFNIETKKMINL